MVTFGVIVPLLSVLECFDITTRSISYSSHINARKLSIMYLKKFLVRLIISLLVLFQCFVLGIYFRSTHDGVNTLVSVELQSYYALPIGSRDTLYFDDSSVDSIQMMSDNVSSVITHRTQMGRRVSRENLVQVAFPVRKLVIQQKPLLQLLRRHEKGISKRCSINAQHLSELDYYAKKHSVVDEGYNEVMRYRAFLLQSYTDDKRVLQKLRYFLSVDKSKKDKRKRKFRAYRHTEYRVNGGSYVRTLDSNTSFFSKSSTLPQQGLVTLEPSGQVVAKRINGNVLMDYLHPVPDTTHKQFIDSLGIAYNLKLIQSSPVRWYGTSLSPNGTYYEGLFDATFQRHGQGFSVDRHLVKSGEWDANHFRGERMLYTSDRVYGIDVSRHQHEHGHKRYSIRWNALRITDLGSISKKKVSGAVNYPVSFVFIKATEGKSLLNKYYLSDLKAARAHDIPVAPYHFFTHLSCGLQQAKFFVKSVRLSKATLPPMLDVEPSNAQISKMGGREVLFKEMLIWLRHVEQYSHRRPILYVSQQFVNQHLVHAPDALRKYEVWIARYGEFKPYVKLTFWQLSTDGKVRGIHGDVDINVYNGTKSDFHAWRNS